MSTASRLRIVLYCLLAGVVGILVGSRALTTYTSVPPVDAAPGVPITTAAGIQTTFAPIVEKDLPALVNISSSRVVRNSGSQVPPFMMDPFFRQFFGDSFGRQFQPDKQVEKSLGSGVIVKSDGYLVTNNHVIDGATDITVTLSDKRNLKAKVVGTDSKTDIAVLKVNATNLPTLAFDDSSKVKVGDLALAMGNPFGIGQTVTLGIISAKGRNNLGIEDYEDFIQTDAAINPGNSGGALVDTRGDLIGINTAILSHGSGGNEGVGFAIPINMVRVVMNQILEHGKVVRGYMGVRLEEITPAMAGALHLTDVRGVLLADVANGSPAAKAGLERGDVVTDVDGERVDNMKQFQLRVSMTAPGTTIHLKLLRDGMEKTADVKLVEMPAERTQSRSPSANPISNALDGVSVENLNGQVLNELNLPQRTTGVVVTDVDDASAAAMAGLQSGDVIQEVDHARISDASDFNRAMRRAPGHTVLLLVNRGGTTYYIAIEPR